MRTDCMQAVAQALGREVTAAEMQGIEDRLVRSLKRVAKRDPEAFHGMTRQQRYDEAAKLAAEDLSKDAELKKQRGGLTAAVHAQQVRALHAARGAGRTMFEGLAGQMRKAELRGKGIANQYFSALMDTWRATEPRILGLIEDAKGVRALVQEMFGEDSGNAAAKSGAQAWLRVTEAMRQRANAAGFDIRRRRDWHLPQLHDTERIRGATVEAYVRDVMPLLDRRQYLTKEGRQMDDAELAEVVVTMKRTLSTEGVTGLDPVGPPGSRMLASRRAESRELHFKDSASWLDYHAKYGAGTVYGALQGHVAGLAREIGLAESFGPNPEVMFKTLHYMASNDAALHGGSDAIGPFFVSTDALWKTLSGYTGQIYNGDQGTYQRIASVAQGVRNVEVAGKLQGALLSSVTDIPTFFATVGFNRLPLLTATQNLVRSFGGQMTEYANRSGLIADSVVSDLNRWAADNIGNGWTSRVANATLKASLLTYWTDSIKRAFSVTMMGGMGKLSRTEWAALDAADRRHLERKGITEVDWQVYRKATPEDWRGQRMLTPESIQAIPAEQLRAFGDPAQVKNAAISKLLGTIVDESEYAAVSPDVYTRAALQRGTQRGSIEGEIARSIALFKSFPIAMISRHWMRVLETERFGGTQGAASQVAYAAALAVGLTIFGAVAWQLKSLRDGKDPASMDDPKFWGAAFMQGGGAGILGDFLYAGMGGTNRYDQSLWSSVLGPVAGSVEDALKLTIGNAAEAAQGKDTHAGAEAMRFARSHLPLVNLWYLKTVLDRAVLNDLQEYLSPGYLDRMKSRTRQEFGQEYFWAPGNSIEDMRAPDLGRAFGG